jgi:hypothetical protein
LPGCAGFIPEKKQKSANMGKSLTTSLSRVGQSHSGYWVPGGNLISLNFLKIRRLRSYVLLGIGLREHCFFGSLYASVPFLPLDSFLLYLDLVCAEHER